MSDWVLEKFKDHFAIGLRNGLTKPSRIRGSGVRMVNMKEIFGYDFIDDKTPMELVPVTDKEFESSNLEYGDLLFARQSLTEAGAGKVAIYLGSSPTVFESHLIRCRINKQKSDSRFLYYLFKSSIGKGAVSTIVQQVAAAGIKGSDLQELDFLTPQIEEQKAIASVLSSLDDKIDLLYRQNTTLERMAETLFRQWFVEEAQSFKLGKIGDLIEGTFGGEWGKEAPEGEFINAANCIRGTDIADLQTGLAKKIPLRFVSTKKLQSVEPKNGDIIFEISGGTETQSTGRATYINDDVRSLFTYRLVFSNFCRLLRPLNSDYTYFIYLYLSYLYGQDEFFGLENGSSGIKNLNYKALFFELDYPMPTLDRVQEFNHLVTPNFSKINQNKKQIQTLEKLRDNLLPKLMSGEVRVAL